MKRLFIFGIISLFVFGMIAAPELGVQAQEKKSDPKAMKIIEQMIEAIGGRKVMQSVTDMNATGTMELVQQGMEASVTIMTKQPDKFRLDIEVMGMSITQAFDGENGWYTNPQTGSVEDMTGEQLEEMKRQAIGDETYLNPEKHGIVFVYKGQEKLEDTDHDVLLMTYADGTEVTMYLDSKTHLVYKTISIQPNAMTGVEAEVESYTTEYKEVDNMMAAFNITQYMDGEEYLVIMLEEVKFNTGLEDSLFIKQ